MFASKQAKTDNVQHSVHRTRCFLEAVEAVSDGLRTDFLGLEIKEKQEFLTENAEEIIATCVAKFGKDFENLRHFDWFIVENEGRAVIYFEKKNRK